MMLEKIRAVMRIYGSFLPRPVRELIEELGAQVDQLRAELDQVKPTTNQPKESESCKSGTK